MPLADDAHPAVPAASTTPSPWSFPPEQLTTFRLPVAREFTVQTNGLPAASGKEAAA